MPELPEVETVRRGLAPFLEGARILQLELRRKDLRFPFPEAFATRVEGWRVTSLTRRAKYLLIELDSGETIISHLGMSGSFKIHETIGAPVTPGDFHHERSKLAAHDHVVFHLESESGVPCTITYNDPRRFGFMLMHATAQLADFPMIGGLGIEPLGNELSGTYLANLFDGRKTTLKAALLDQRLIAGLGNIYVCEALWRSGLSPFDAVGSVGKKAELLASSIRAVLGEAVQAGGSSLRDHRQADGSLGYFQHNFAVYGREGEPCRARACTSAIERAVQNGRSTFFCPTCQNGAKPRQSGIVNTG